ncbi:MAG TPA: hypothetical protein VGF45_19085, partial [Polyangia bacterium]
MKKTLLGAVLLLVTCENRGARPPGAGTADAAGDAASDLPPQCPVERPLGGDACDADTGKRCAWPWPPGSAEEFVCECE